VSKRYSSLFVGQEPSAEPPEQGPAAPYRLLLVDDEPGILAALRRVFQRENYELHFARNGVEALKILANQPVHLISPTAHREAETAKAHRG